MFDQEEACPYCGKGDSVYLTRYTENKIKNGIVSDECFTHQTLVCKRCNAEIYHWCFISGSNDTIVHIADDRSIRFDGEYAI